jgi:hypothetical protein
MAAIHPALTRLGAVAILAISAAPLYAQTQQPSADTLKVRHETLSKSSAGISAKVRPIAKLSNSMIRSTKRKIP